MRKVIFNIMTTLDGFYARENGDIDWHYADAEHEQYAIELLKTTDTLVFGRKTYEGMVQYWPTAPRDPIADAMNGLPKWVFSRTLRTADWNNSRLTAEPPAQVVQGLKREPGGNIVMFGSVELANTFAALDLFDEYQVQLCPVLIGKGLSLLPNLRERRFKLKSSRVRNSGVVELHYVP